MKNLETPGKTGSVGRYEFVKHGCGVKLFGFSRANHASTKLKKFTSSKLEKFTLFTHSFVS